MATVMPPWIASLRVRLLLATVAAVTLALLFAGLTLASLFRDHVLRQHEAMLTDQLRLIAAALTVDANGRPSVEAARLTDPRWSRPYSGLYWQIDRVGPNAGTRDDVERSRSLWDFQISLAADPLADGEQHVHYAEGPQGQALQLVERTLSARVADGTAQFRLMVAADLAFTRQAVRDFNTTLTLSMCLLGLLLAMAALAQVRVGLAPLRALQQAVTRLRSGDAARLKGGFPAELQPLVQDFNAVLDHSAELTVRARAQAGNLAHALKTPLAVMKMAALNPEDQRRLSDIVLEQTAQAQRHLDWHLAQARAAATHRLPGQRCDVASAVFGLRRVMERVHAERGLTWDISVSPPTLAFAGESEDFQQMVGNLMDNAGRWARSRVQLLAHPDEQRLIVEIEDDGPGIAPKLRSEALRRGRRLDASGPGSGLGLAIANELCALYGGSLNLDDATIGGLRVTLTLPLATRGGLPSDSANLLTQVNQSAARSVT